MQLASLPPGREVKGPADGCSHQPLDTDVGAGGVYARCGRCLQTCILLPACPVLGPSWRGWDGSGDLGGRCRCAQGASWMFLSPQACGQAGFPVVGIRGHSAWSHSALSTCCGWWGWRPEPHLSQEPCMGEG